MNTSLTLGSFNIYMYLAYFVSFSKLDLFLKFIFIF